MLIVRCKNIGGASSMAEQVLEESLIHLIGDGGHGQDVADDAFLEYCEEIIPSKMFDLDGEVRLRGSEQEYWNTLRDPIGMQAMYIQEVVSLMSMVAQENDDVFWELSNNYAIGDIQMVQRMPDCWILRVEVAPYG